MQTNGVPQKEPITATLTQIDIQCTKAKTEIYRIKVLAEHHVHAERRQTMLELFKKAYDAFDELQSFVTDRADR